MGTLNLTTADNNLTLTVNGTIIKQLYANSTKVYQKWKTENYTETQKDYSSYSLENVNIDKMATYTRDKTAGGSYIEYNTYVDIDTKKADDSDRVFDNFYFVVSYNGTVLHTSPKNSTLEFVPIGTWRNYGPNGTGNYNSIQPKIDVTVYVYEGTGYVPYSFSSQFPVITGQVSGTVYHYTEKLPLNKRAYISTTISGTRRVEDN